ncbi:MAG: hypothetical protein HYU80_03560 [Candidatus Blackburnbacteria bacterium]|nr:hypothetical protein [Candidatus Blackburnbacteria bacterium]
MTVEIETRVIQDAQTIPQNGRLNGAFHPIDNLPRLSEADVARALAEGIRLCDAWMKANFKEIRVPLNYKKIQILSFAHRTRIKKSLMTEGILRQMFKETI